MGAGAGAGSTAPAGFEGQPGGWRDRGFPSLLGAGNCGRQVRRGRTDVGMDGTDVGEGDEFVAGTDVGKTRADVGEGWDRCGRGQDSYVMWGSW